MQNAINWFEIPVTDMDRAVKFYSTVLSASLTVETMDSGQMAMLPSEQGAVGGALFKSEGYKPSQEGAVLYLNGGDDLSQPLNRVAGAGGQVVMPKTGIGENGFIAFFFDTEGNKVGLHSMG